MVLSVLRTHTQKKEFKDIYQAYSCFKTLTHQMKPTHSLENINNMIITTIWNIYFYFVLSSLDSIIKKLIKKTGVKTWWPIRIKAQATNRPHNTFPTEHWPGLLRERVLEPQKSWTFQLAWSSNAGYNNFHLLKLLGTLVSPSAYVLIFEPLDPCE